MLYYYLNKYFSISCAFKIFDRRNIYTVNIHTIRVFIWHRLCELTPFSKRTYVGVHVPYIHIERVMAVIYVIHWKRAHHQRSIYMSAPILEALYSCGKYFSSCGPRCKSFLRVLTRRLLNMQLHNASSWGERAIAGHTREIYTRSWGKSAYICIVNALSIIYFILASHMCGVL